MLPSPAPGMERQQAIEGLWEEEGKNQACHVPWPLSGMGIPVNCVCDTQKEGQFVCHCVIWPQQGDTC
jgi:hypothetical protein